MKKNQENLINLYAAILGVIVFIAMYGVRVLNPLYTDWLFGKAKDLSQHYLGWEFYRKGAWNFPVGMTDQIAYPAYTSVIFTDSIPLFAVIFKLFSPALPQSFQYMGWWGLLSFALQGFFATKILRQLSLDKAQTLIGSVLFVISPIIIEKMFRHTALGGHWIILVSIYLFIRHFEDYNKIIRTSVQWGIIGGLVALIHLYYLPMCGIFAGAYIMCSFMMEKKIKIKYVAPFLSFMVCLLANTYLLGGFSSNAGMSSDGLGEYSFNLNGFFYEKGYSRFFGVLKTYKDGQYEGFAYLGLGVFVLLALAIVYMIICLKKQKIKGIIAHRNRRIYTFVYIFISLALIIFAASPQVTFNDKLLFELPDIDIIISLWSVFRATGRIIWPVFYLIIIGVIICNDRLCKIIGEKFNMREYLPVIVLVLCVGLQVADLSEKIYNQRQTFSKKEEYVSPLRDSIWHQIAEDDKIKHVVCASNVFENIDYINIAKYAHDNDLTMNNFYFARGIDVRENTQYSLQNLSEEKIYIFKADDIDIMSEYDLNYYEADGYVIGLVN